MDTRQKWLVVCMDQTWLMLQISLRKTRDTAVLIGNLGKELITADDLACLCNTIPYEILTGIGPRVPRFYIDKNIARIWKSDIMIS